jgi:hypothetical protein
MCLIKQMMDLYSNKHYVIWNKLYNTNEITIWDIMNMQEKELKHTAFLSWFLIII